MAAEGDGGVAAEHERRLVALARESPATVSALIRLIRQPETNYRARNFGVKVLSQVGAAAATTEFVEALAETHCPVPGAFLRVMRALGKDATPILTAGFRHANPTIRTRATVALRVLGRTDPAIQKLFDALQAEPPLLQKMREGTPAERGEAVAALAELARTTPGAATVLVNALKGVSDKDVLVEAESRLTVLGRESPEVVAALVAGVRSEDDYHLRRLALKVLPKVGATLNCKETVEALGDHSCPVPGAMRRILFAAGADALPVLGVARKHANPEIRAAAESILQRMPRPAGATSASPQP
jgi:HEAT repeat protein